MMFNKYEKFLNFNKLACCDELPYTEKMIMTYGYSGIIIFGFLGIILHQLMFEKINVNYFLNSMLEFYRFVLWEISCCVIGWWIGTVYILKKIDKNSFKYVLKDLFYK